MWRRTAAISIAVAIVGGYTAGASAQEGPWQVRVGSTSVKPKSNNSPVVNVDDNSSLTFTISYYFNDNWAFEVLAAVPFEHDIELLDGTVVGDTEHLPPTFTIQYHFLPNGRFRPYAGLGINYTTFTSESTTGPLTGSDLSLDASTGLAIQLGADFMINDNWLINVDLRSIDIETDAELDGAALTTVAIDPSVFGINVGYRF
jgi:outer membrane protein